MKANPDIMKEIEKAVRAGTKILVGTKKDKEADGGE
jgi:hypothetical protein